MNYSEIFLIIFNERKGLQDTFFIHLPANGLSRPFLLPFAFSVDPFFPFGPNELIGRGWLVLFWSFSNAKLSRPDTLTLCFGAKAALSLSVDDVDISSVVDWMERGDGVGVDDAGVFIWIRSSESPPTEIVISWRYGAAAAALWSVWSLILQYCFLFYGVEER